MNRSNPDDMRNQGYTINMTVYPWMATGPSGLEHECYTDIEMALIKMLRIHSIPVDGMLREQGLSSLTKGPSK